MTGSEDAVTKKIAWIVSVWMTVCVLFAVGTSVFAAPTVVSGWDTGNTGNLVYVTNPSFSGGTVADAYCAVSGWAAQGTTLSLYRANQTGVFEQVTGGVAVGGSGMFFMPVWLNAGRNCMMVRAELWNGNYQQVRCDVNLIGHGFTFPAR